MKISLSSVVVDDQAKALAFYTDILGFRKKVDVPAGDHRWLTVVSPDDPDGTQLALEPNMHPASQVFQAALYVDGIPYMSFEVVDMESEVKRLTELGVRFKGEPTDIGDAVLVTLDDTCGNYIQLYETK